MDMVKNLASKVQNFDIKQVPREYNTDVYTLANNGFAFKINPKIKIPISIGINPIILIEDIKE